MKQILKNFLDFSKQLHLFLILGIISIICTGYGIYKNIPIKIVTGYIVNTEPYLNIIFHICSIFSALFIVYCCKKHFLKDFLLNLNNKKHRFIINSWVNISYLIYAHYTFASTTYNLKLMLHKLPAEADSISIPIFSTIILLFILAIFYYIFMNIFLKKIFHSHILTRSVNIICPILILFAIIDIFGRVNSVYYYHDLILDILAIIWIVIWGLLIKYFQKYN